MRAVRYHEGGDADVLQIDEVERPTPDGDEVLVEIHAASVNPVDAKRRQRGDGILPKTTGGDFGGVVADVGEDVEDYEVGDRVLGSGLQAARFQQGSFAEYATVPVEIIAHLPETVSYREGAAVGTVGSTAWRAVVDYGRVQPTDACLVHGGSGGVGHIAVQLANEMGGRVVSTAGSEAARTTVEDLGADVVFDYARDDLLDAVSEVSGDGFDVILDHRVGDYAQFDIDAAAFGGRLVCFGGYEFTVTDALLARYKELSVQWMGLSNLMLHGSLPTLGSILEKLVQLMAEDRLRVEIARGYELDEAAEAHRAVLEDHFVGKLVVDVRS